MKFKPHDYQKYAIEYLVRHPVAALFLDCGLGKTACALMAIRDLAYDCFEVSRVLVIAPLRVANNTWPDEIRKWEDFHELSYSVVTGTEKERRAALMKPALIYITNRESVPWLVKKGYFSFDMVVIDELSSFKNYRSQRFRALRSVRSSVKRIVGLTGTPAPNSLMDLFGEIGILDMGQRLGRYITRFREQYFVPDKRNREIIYSYKPKEGAEDAIYQKISDICISMRSKDLLKMPDLVTTNVEVRMNEKEQALYDQMEREMFLPFKDAEIDATSAAGLSSKLHQMADGAVYDDETKVIQIHERKYEALEDIIEESCGRPVLVAYWYRFEKEELMKRFGAVPIDTPESIHAWNEGRIPCAMIHPASAGMGINLQQGGCHLVWFSTIWSLELYQQTNDRLFRQGQKDTVVIQHLITKGTVDEDVMQALARKDLTQEALMSAVRARIRSTR